MLLLIGTQLLALGFVAELISALLARDSDAYSVAEHTSPEKAKSDELAAQEASEHPLPQVKGDSA